MRHLASMSLMGHLNILGTDDNHTKRKQHKTYLFQFWHISFQLFEAGQDYPSYEYVPSHTMEFTLTHDHTYIHG